MKIYKAYFNDELKKYLSKRDEIIEAIKNEMKSDYYDYTEENKECIKRYLKLTQFEKDVIYLSSIMSVRKVAALYAVSPTHIYNHIKLIRKKLSNTQ